MILKNSPDLWIDQFPFPGDADHKYSRGLVLINSGPVFKTGAARLAGRAAMRVGAGAVKLICDKESAQILEPQISVELIAVIKNKNEPTYLYSTFRRTCNNIFRRYTTSCDK